MLYRYEYFPLQCGKSHSESSMTTLEAQEGRGLLARTTG
jgi:hypothetical protein